MNISPRWVALAAVIALSASAAAQTDASSAAVHGPAAAPELWERVVAVVAAKGKSEPLPDGPGYAYVLEDKHAPAKGRKSVDTVSMLAVRPANGRVKAVAMQFIHSEEEYDAATKTTKVYLSIYEADDAGRLVKATHQRDVKAPGAEWVTDIQDKVDIASAEARSEYAEFLNRWALY